MANQFEADDKFLIKEENEQIKIICNTPGSKELTRKGILIKKDKKYIFEMELFKRFRARTQIILSDDKNNTLKEFELKTRTTHVKTILFSKNEDLTLIVKLKFIRGRIGDFLFLKNFVLKPLEPLYNEDSLHIINLDNLLKSSRNIQSNNQDKREVRRTVYNKNKSKIIVRKSNIKNRRNRATLTGVSQKTTPKNKALIDLNIPEYIKNNEIDESHIDKNYIEILYPIADRVSFLRTILLPDKYKNIYYLIPEECKSYIISNLIYSKLMDKIFFVRGWSDITKIIDYLNPIRIYLTVFPYVKILEKLAKYLHIITFVHHGIIVDRKAISKIDKGWNKDIKYMVPNIEGKSILNNSKLENVELISGLPQFDYSIKNLENQDILRENFCKKHNINKNTKIVLLIHGSSPGKYYSNRDFLKKVKSAIGQVRKSTGIFLIVKFKYKYRNLTNEKNTVSLVNKDLIYDYYFADAVIVVEGGTALVETLLTVPEKTIVIDWLTNATDIYKVNKLKLLKAKDLPEFQTKLSKLLLVGAYENLDKIKNETDYYLNKILGYDKVELISDKILELDGVVE